MSLPFTALSAVTSTGPGPSRDLEGIAREYTLVVTHSGSTQGGATVDLEGSHDGVNWFRLLGTGFGTGATGTLVTSLSSSDLRHLVRYVRANLTSNPGSPTITATVVTDVDEED